MGKSLHSGLHYSWPDNLILVDITLIIITTTAESEGFSREYR